MLGIFTIILSFLILPRPSWQSKQVFPINEPDFYVMETIQNQTYSSVTSSTHQDSWFQLGELFLKQNQPQLNLYLLQHAEMIHQQPPPKVEFMLAISFAMIGKKQEAQKHLSIGREQCTKQREFTDCPKHLQARFSALESILESSSSPNGSTSLNAHSSSLQSAQ